MIPVTFCGVERDAECPPATVTQVAQAVPGRRGSLPSPFLVREPDDGARRTLHANGLWLPDHGLPCIAASAHHSSGSTLKLPGRLGKPCLQRLYIQGQGRLQKSASTHCS
jgi:hypothetical protein